MKLSMKYLPSKGAIVGTTFMLALGTTHKNTYGQELIDQSRYETKDYIAEIINGKTIENIIIDDTQNHLLFNDSIKFVGNNEINIFYNFFFGNSNINTNIFIDKIKELQKEFGIKQDGILGPNTLKNIYLNYYSKNIETLSFETKKRLKIYQDILGYKNIKGHINSNINTFKLETFYGSNMGLNIAGTYINQELVGVFRETLDKKENLITFKNIDGRSVLLFYIEGKLELATFCSPGRTNNKSFTPGLITNGQRTPSKLHFSSLYPKTYSKKGGALMPYSVHINGPFWIHGSNGIINGKPASAGCVRVGLYYMEYLYSKVSQLGIKNVKIDTRNIY